ncbi:MAG: hypothetical protein GXO66_09130 [Euryarchaeota archaeon]|nr:hypothetical protein [Euryarchaeota archaeon]
MNRLLALALAALLLLNFLLFVFGVTNALHFWLVVALVLIAMRLSSRR